MSYATSDASSSWSATTYFTNLGNDPSVEYYLTVSYLQTGFGYIYQTFVDVIVLVNDEPQFDVICDGHGECGDEYLLCLLNKDVSQYITSQTGGTLQLNATGTGSGDWSNTCPGDEEPYFKVQYILSKVRIAVPTLSPTSASGPTAHGSPTQHPSSSLPTSVPSANPTLLGGDVPHVYHYNSTVDTYPVVEASIGNLGYVFDANDSADSECYLSIRFLQTGFGDDSDVYVDVFAIDTNGIPIRVQDKCSVHNECGNNYITCGSNIDVTQFLSSKDGGTLTLRATSTNAWQIFCGVYLETPFQVEFTITRGYSFPTISPTVGPKGSGISSNVPFAFTACVAVVMAIFGAVIADTRKKKADVHEVDGIWMQYTLVVFGCILGSQVFFIYTCFTDADYSIYGFSIIVIKVCVMILNGVCLYISTRSNSCDLDWDLVTEYISLYNTLSFLCCLQLKLMYLLPWRTSVFASVSGGFPSFQMYCISYFLFMCESMLIAGVQVLFAVHFHDIFDLDKLTRVSFFLSIGFTGVFSVMSCLEMMLIYRSHQARNVKPESKSESRDSLREKLIEGESSWTGT